MLDTWPPGSLGYWYAKFMTGFDLTEETYLTTAIEQAEPFADDAERSWFHLRFDSSHDIRHVLTGYGPTRLGEVCICCFRFAQIRHPGLIVFVLFGFVSLLFERLFEHRGPVLAPMWEAYCRGRRARLLDLLPWENGFSEPLAVHRATLFLNPPRHYPNSFAPEAYLRGNTLAEYYELDKSGQTERAFEVT